MGRKDAPLTHCRWCAKPLVRKIRKDGCLESRVHFAARKYCDRSCLRRGQERSWTQEAAAEVARLREQGHSTARIAGLISHRFGLGAVTKNMVIRQAGRPAPTRKAPKAAPPTEETPPPLPTLVLDKPHSQCRHADCRRGRQPGKDFCAEHNDVFVTARMDAAR